MDWNVPRRISRDMGMLMAVYTKIRPIFVSYSPMVLTTLYTGCSSAVVGTTRDRDRIKYSRFLPRNLARANT